MRHLIEVKVGRDDLTRIFWRENKENGSGGDSPPVSCGGSFGQIGEVVLVESKTEIVVFGKMGLGGEKIPDIRVSFLEFFKKRSEPTGELAPFGGKGGEPHLPVESGLERGDLGWETVWGAGLVFKYDRLPLDSVGTALEGEFGASSGHDSKKAVSRGQMPWGKSSFPLGEKG
jgi:hypothetical protein